MPEKREALLIANYEYEDEGLRRLVAPAQDAESLADVLSDPAIGGFGAKTLLNESSHQIRVSIDEFFADRKRDDLLLLYISGHGIKDTDGRLYFAAPDTKRGRLASTGVSANFVNELMHRSRSRRQVLLLDCCYSGAFARGMSVRADQTISTGEHFQEGRGHVVLTASDAMQYAFEGEDIRGQGITSVFTQTLINGLTTGEADLNQDGQVSVDELYDYIYDRVIDQMPEQKPRKWAFDLEGEIVIANNPNPVVQRVELPVELQESITDLRPWVREGAVRELARLLHWDDPALAEAAREALQRLANDDSGRVSEAASMALSHTRPKPDDPIYLPEAPAPLSSVTQSKSKLDAFYARHPHFRRWWRVGAGMIATVPAFISFYAIDSGVLALITLFSSTLLFGSVGIEHLVRGRRRRGWLFLLTALFWLGSMFFCFE